jgi:hypothetical protein
MTFQIVKEHFDWFSDSFPSLAKLTKCPHVEGNFFSYKTFWPAPRLGGLCLWFSISAMACRCRITHMWCDTHILVQSSINLIILSYLYLQHHEISYSISLWSHDPSLSLFNPTGELLIRRHLGRLYSNAPQKTLSNKNRKTVTPKTPKKVGDEIPGFLLIIHIVLIGPGGARLMPPLVRQCVFDSMLVYIRAQGWGWEELL